MSNIPNIRFKGFTDAWEQRKFGDENDLLTGYPFESEKYVEEGITLVRGMNVKRGYLDLSDEICMKWDSPEGLENYLLEDGDILIQMDGALIGKSYARIAQNQLPALLVQRVTRARTKKDIANSDFMYQTIQRDFLLYIKMNKTETAVPHLSLNDIRDFIIMVPSLDEQRKIGEFFTNLDNLITLHQRKCDQMKMLKKYMLQKMFPKKGQKVPEIRFDGFTDAWEQRKLGDWCEFINGDRSSNYPSATEFVECGVPFVGSDALGSTLIDKIKLRYITYDKYEKMKGLKIKVNDILYTLRGAGFGKCAIADFSDGTVASSLVGIRCNDNLQAKFLIQWLSSSNAENEKNKAVNGSTAQNISVEDMKKYILSVPGLDEQERISNYLYNLDNLITLHQGECEKLKKLKKYMLQNMFPKKG